MSKSKTASVPDFGKLLSHPQSFIPKGLLSQRVLVGPRLPLHPVFYRVLPLVPLQFCVVKGADPSKFLRKLALRLLEVSFLIPGVRLSELEIKDLFSGRFGVPVMQVLVHAGAGLEGKL